jgi:Ser/Thr protein kinase RdoA (MazF antagonist)
MSVVENPKDYLDRVARQVWQRFRSARPDASLVYLGNRGGFSGARLWKCQGISERLCLRAWPRNRTAAQIRQLHQWMKHARGQGLEFVPFVYSSGNGDSAIGESGHVWELTQWMQGQADFVDNPSSARLEAACESLAQLHRSWEAFVALAQPCPAIRQRLRLMADWHTLIATGWRPCAGACPQSALLWPIAQRAWLGLPDWLRQVTSWLKPWIDFRCPIQPCLRDVWHDHLLFVGERLTGLIDYGAVRADHPAGDLARMLGSLLGEDVVRWKQGLQVYRRVRRLTDQEEALAHALDRTGTVLALVNWLRWLYHEGRSYEDLPAVTRRMEALLARINGWSV